MQKFLFVNTKGLTLEQAVQHMHQELVKLASDERAKGLIFHSMSFVPTMEMVQQSAIAMNGGKQQAQMVVNCCVTLIEPAALPDMDQLAEKFGKIVADQLGDYFAALSDIGREIAEDSGLKLITVPKTDQPTDQQKKDLQLAARFFCQHTRLDGVMKHKSHRGVHPYELGYMMCLDCGAEVWQDHVGDVIPVIRTTGPMHIVPAGDMDPIGDAYDKHQDQIDELNRETNIRNLTGEDPV